MGIYSAIFRKITGNEKKPKQKRKTMARKKLLSPEQKAKIVAGIKKGAGNVIKYSAGKPTVKVKAKPAPKKAPTKTVPAKNFWNDKIDMGFIKPTGKQLVIGASVTVVGGALIYRAVK